MNEFVKSTYYLDPGCMVLNKTPLVIQTVLGNCVSVCLWDKSLAIGSMNHFRYPRTGDKSSATTEYGNVATLALIRMMEEAGCSRENIVAHVLGGARPSENSVQTIGDENIQVARKVLDKKDVKIISEDTGGTIGRKVVFDTATGHVAVLKVHNLRKSDWITD